MAFQFGFAADEGSEDEEAVPSQHGSSSVMVDTPHVPVAAHKLGDLVGMLHSLVHHPPLKQSSISET